MEDGEEDRWGEVDGEGSASDGRRELVCRRVRHESEEEEEEEEEEEGERQRTSRQDIMTILAVKSSRLK